MTRFFLPLAFLITGATLDAAAQRPLGAPDPAVIAAMELVKDQCKKDTPCKYKVKQVGPYSVVTVEFTRQASPTSPPLPYPGGHAELTLDKNGKLVKRVDGD
jgi:hypothetical protein